MIVYNLFYKNNFINTFSTLDNAKLFVSTIYRIQEINEPYWIKNEFTGNMETRCKDGKTDLPYEIRETKVI